MRNKIVGILISMLFIGTSFLSVNIVDNVKADITTVLVGYWSFDEGSGDIVYDYSGNGNDGIIYGAVWTIGISGYALSFDGWDDYVEVLDSPSLNPSDEITLEAWYKPSVSFSGDGNNAIIDKGYGQHVEPYYQYHLGVAGDLYDPSAMFHFNIAAGEGLESYPNTGEGFWSVGNWYHIVGTFDGYTMRLYVNGELIDSTEPISELINYGQNVVFGSFSDIESMWGVGHDYTPGIIDEIRIYNRALNDNEILFHYKEYTEGCTHTLGYWKYWSDPAKHYDVAWDQIGGPDTAFFGTGMSYLEILNTPPKGGNAYLILAHQYIATELNGCYNDPISLPSDIHDIMTEAAILLDYYNSTLHPKTGMPTIPIGDDRTEAINIAYVLNEFNDGYLYWPHCDENNIINKLNNIQLLLQRFFQRFPFFEKILNQIKL